MCFFKDGQLYAKRHFRKFSQVEKTSPQEEALPEKNLIEKPEVEDLLVKKQKTLEEQAPGLFNHLMKLAQEDQSTECPSEITSDHESEDGKHSVLISNDVRILRRQEDHDLSNVIRMKPLANLTEVFPIPEAAEIYGTEKETLDEKAPGLFSHLVRLANGEINTEEEEVKNQANRKDQDNHNLSNVIRFQPIVGLNEVFAIPEAAEIYGNNKETLDEKAPGLFSHLMKLVHGETTSFEEDVEKQAMLRKHKEQCDLSNVIRVQPFVANTFENEQQMRILELLSQNAQILENITVAHDSHKKVMDCIDGLKELRAEIAESNVSQLEKIELLKEKKKSSGQFNSNPTASSLFNSFFGTGHLYRYELVLDSQLPSPIFREKSLVLNVKLVDIFTKQVVSNENKINLSLSLHTWEIPSNPILRNKSGNRAVMGDTETELSNGEAIFDRLQVNEVTSKFIHGYVAMVIVPSKPSNSRNVLVKDNSDSDIDIQSIKPLMLEKVVVKSKKKNQKKQDN